MRETRLPEDVDQNAKKGFLREEVLESRSDSGVGVSLVKVGNIIFQAKERKFVKILWREETAWHFWANDRRPVGFWWREQEGDKCTWKWKRETPCQALCEIEGSLSPKNNKNLLEGFKQWIVIILFLFGKIFFFLQTKAQFGEQPKGCKEINKISPVRWMEAHSGLEWAGYNALGET